MNWTEISVKTSCENSEAAASVMQMVSSGIYIEDYRNLEENVMEIAHVDLIDDSLLAKDRQNVIIHAYFDEGEADAKASYIKERLDALAIKYELVAAEVRDTDWAESWKKYYKPFTVGERLLICPEWEECEPSGRTVLSLEPGLAFGTGTHETTKLCLELAEHYVFEGCAVLDIGCGSGILGIAALLLGAKSITAVDIDPIAVKTAAKNGALNGFADDKLHVKQGNLVDCLKDGEKFDIAFANIIADAIISLAPQIAKYMKRGGTLICSGIIDTKLDTVVKAIKQSGMSIEKIQEENGWAAVVAAVING